MRILTLSMLLAVAGCGDDSAPQSDLSGTPDASANDFAGADQSGSADLAGVMQACNDYVNALCMAVQRCAPFYQAVNYGDTATCIQRLGLNCNKSSVLKGSNLTPELVEQCLPAYATISCTDLFAGTVPAPCTIPAGSLASGTTCGDGAQCATNYCQKSIGGVCGTCAAAPAAGDDCSTIASCGTGLSCAANQKCVAVGKLNSVCDANHPCAANLTCVIPKNMASGTCVASAEANQTCDPLQQTGPSCDVPNGVYCDPLTKSCKPIGLAMPGQACGIGVNGVTFCVAGGVCHPNDGGMIGTCVAPAADSGQCSLDPKTGPGCLIPAACTNGLCSIPDPSAC